MLANLLNLAGPSWSLTAIRRPWRALRMILAILSCLAYLLWAKKGEKKKEKMEKIQINFVPRNNKFVYGLCLISDLDSTVKPHILRTLFSCAVCKITRNNLSILSLGVNQLIGQIPEEIGNLVNLVSLNLYYNNIQSLFFYYRYN